MALAMVKTIGARLLRVWMSKDPKLRTQSYIARKLGVSQPSVSGWLRYLSRPETHHRISLRRLAKIPESSWITPQEMRLMSRASDRMSRVEKC